MSRQAKRRRDTTAVSSRAHVVQYYQIYSDIFPYICYTGFEDYALLYVSECARSRYTHQLKSISSGKSPGKGRKMKKIISLTVMLIALTAACILTGCASSGPKPDDVVLEGDN